MVYNLYQGNTGRVTRVDDEPGGPTVSGESPVVQKMPEHRPVAAPPPGLRRPPSPLSGLSGELGRLLNRLSPMHLETEDLLLIMVLYLMYRESGDEELLLTLVGLLIS